MLKGCTHNKYYLINYSNNRKGALHYHRLALRVGGRVVIKLLEVTTADYWLLASSRRFPDSLFVRHKNPESSVHWSLAYNSCSSNVSWGRLEICKIFGMWCKQIDDHSCVVFDGVSDEQTEWKRGCISHRRMVWFRYVAGCVFLDSKWSWISCCNKHRRVASLRYEQDHAFEDEQVEWNLCCISCN